MPPDEHDLLRTFENSHWWYDVLHWLVLRELEHVPQDANLLDVGCGTGGLLSKMNRVKAQGIDVSAHAISHCRGRGLSSVQAASVHDLPFADESFDVVTCLNVLYHEMVDDSLALNEMARVLRPGGRLVFNEPAFDCLRGGHDDRVCGARRYTVSHVRHLLERHNLEPKMLHYWNAWLFLPLLVRRRCGRAGTSDLHSLPRWLNAVFCSAGRVDAAMARWLHLPFGSSVFGIVGKPGSTDSVQPEQASLGELAPT
ncbi:MAG: class I SAM-dependent methyltransferase [Verrucomicrobiaceae bacterium]|nr:class I SAM-dependent methyltransferase [Verrucomicrobiaceae bacterium]